MVDHLVSETNGLKLDIEVAIATFLNKERKKLEDKTAWDVKAVKPKAQVVAEAKKLGVQCISAL